MPYQDPIVDELNRRFPRGREIPYRRYNVGTWVIVALLIFLVLMAVQCHAQTVSPLVVECGLKCRGSFTVTNNGLVPMVVIVEGHSFSLKAGEPTYRPLDSTVSLKLSEMSARIPPKAAHAFSYNIMCAQEPCLVTLYASMIVGHTPAGLAVKVQLPHTIYLCAKQKGCREMVFKQSGGLSAAK